MSASSASSAVLTSLPIYKGTIFTFLANNRLQLTHRVNGRTVASVLNLQTVENTKMHANFLLTNHAKLCFAFTINTTLDFSPTGCVGRIGFKFSSIPSRDSFKEFSLLPSLLETVGFKEIQEPEEALQLSYTSSKTDDVDKLNAKFTAVNSAVGETFKVLKDCNKEVVVTLTLQKRFVEDITSFSPVTTPRSTTRTPVQTPKDSNSNS